MSTISTLVALPYELGRWPLAVIDRRVTRRLSDTSPAHLVLDRAVGATDRLAGTLLHNDTITRRGTDRLRRSANLATAVRLEAEAEARREAAHDVAEAGRQKAAQQRAAAADRAASAPAEAQKAEAQDKQKAAADAAKTEATKKKAADQKAAKRTDSVEQRKQRVAEAAEARKKAARTQAKVDLDDARASKDAAAADRADAEILGDVTEAKKQERKDG